MFSERFSNNAFCPHLTQRWARLEPIPSDRKNDLAALTDHLSSRIFWYDSNTAADISENLRRFIGK